MDDDQSEDLILAALTLAVSVRTDSTDTVRQAAAVLVAAADGDPIAAVSAVAALIDIDRPVDAWWQDPYRRPEAVPDQSVLSRHGTHNGYNLHRDRSEYPCPACVLGESRYQRARYLRQAARKELVA